MRNLLYALILMPALVVAETCVTLDKKDLNFSDGYIRAITYRAVYEAGYNLLPRVEGDNVCFKDVPKELDLKKTLAAKNLNDIYDVYMAELAAAEAEESIKDAERAALHEAIKSDLENFESRDRDDVLRRLLQFIVETIDAS